MTFQYDHTFPSEIRRLVALAIDKFGGDKIPAMEFIAAQVELSSPREIYRWMEGRVPKKYEPILNKLQTALSPTTSNGSKTATNLNERAQDKLYKLVMDLQRQMGEMQRELRAMRGQPAEAQGPSREKKVWILRQAKLSEFED